VQSQKSIGVCSWSLHPQSPRELIDRVKATGLSAVQLALDPLLKDPHWKNCAAELKDAGIRILSGMMGCVGEDYSTIERIKTTGGVMPDTTWPATLANMRAAAPLARSLGLSLVTFHAQTFADQGLKVALETGQEPATALLTFLEHLDRNDVGVNFDPANMLLYGSGDPISALKLLVPRVLQVHIKDAVSSPVAGDWGREVPAGSGQVDWNTFMEVLDTNGFGGNYVIEREAGESRIQDVRKAAAMIR
jgi:sugar phosphate isomerase/epimerase